MPVELENVRHILLTGPPGIGKTTLFIKVCELLAHAKLPLTGFYTKELRSGGSRIGFDVFSLDKKHGPLARCFSADRTISHGNRFVPKVGKYEVDLKSFESIALPSLQIKDTKHIVLIDEIGKMELFSKSFEQTVDTLFQKQDMIIVATVPSKGNIVLVERLKKLQTSKLIEVDLKNRDDLPNKIANSITNTYNELNKV